MDYFTTEYKKNLDAKAAEERRCQENARQHAVEFFNSKFPAFSRMLHTEGYKISGGRVQDWSEEGFPEYTCREILIQKNGKEVDFNLMSSMYFRMPSGCSRTGSRNCPNISRPYTRNFKNLLANSHGDSNHPQSASTTR